MPLGREGSARLSVLPPREPSAACVLVHGDRGDVLVDTGFGSTLEGTERWLRRARADPARLALIALTHMHTDHTGGVGGLQARYGTPVALHAQEAALVHARAPDAGDVRWLAQPLAPFAVQRPLRDGEVLDDHGGPALAVVALGAQTPGHVAYHLPDLDVLLTGDLLQEHDVAWLPPGGEHLDRAFAALDRLEATGALTAIPGHGPPVPDVPGAIERARLRYETWREQPSKGAWHALKRICAATLQLQPQATAATLAALPSVRDYATALGAEPDRLAREVIDELVRVGAVERAGGGLRPTADHAAGGPHRYGPLAPADWPEDLVAIPGAWPFPARERPSVYRTTATRGVKPR
jgi:hydroxyacylglutathione hydrolase